MSHRLLRAVLGLIVVSWAAGVTAAQPRPNIVWIVVEDMSPHFGCYGETTISTPHVDQLAAAGVRFDRAATTAPVCSPSRSALITGMYQTTIGAHHHRSGRGTEKIFLPDGVQLIPQLLQQAGYFTCNGDFSGSAHADHHCTKPGKTDYNFEWTNQFSYDGVDWSQRGPDQPFFAQLQLHGGKLREQKNWEEWAQQVLGSLTDPQSVVLPPYLPRDPVILQDWARYLDAVRYTDLEVGRILDRLQREGLAESTFVFFLTDHGISHVRAKQFCYEAGLRIPLIVRGPGLESGAVRGDLVEHLDVAATTLAIAGIGVPAYLHGQDLLAVDFKPQPYSYAARDRCDETVDRIRSVRSAQFKYIRNFYPDRPYLQPNAYKDNKEIVRTMRRLLAEGKLDSVQSLIMAETRPREELYDLEADPQELNNLAANPDHHVTMIEMRGALANWIADTGDLGQMPESAFMYASDMQAYLNEIRPGNPRRAAEIEANIELMGKWYAERQ